MEDGCYKQQRGRRGGMPQAWHMHAMLAFSSASLLRVRRMGIESLHIEEGMENQKRMKAES